jgi:hypothetical protein
MARHGPAGQEAKGGSNHSPCLPLLSLPRLPPPNHTTPRNQIQPNPTRKRAAGSEPTKICRRFRWSCAAWRWEEGDGVGDAGRGGLDEEEGAGACAGRRGPEIQRPLWKGILGNPKPPTTPTPTLLCSRRWLAPLRRPVIPPLSAFVVRKDGKERGCSFIDLLPSPLPPPMGAAVVQREMEETSEIVHGIKKKTWSSSHSC